MYLLEASETIAEARRQKRVLYCLGHCDVDIEGLIERDDLETFNNWITQLQIDAKYILVACEIEFEVVQENTDFSDNQLTISDSAYKWLEDRIIFET